MSREMISAIARDFNKNMCSDREVLESCTECAGSIENSPCLLYEIATRIYKAGYRKQEWISVDERLPDREGKYLVCTTNGNIGVGNFIDCYGKGTHLCFDCWAVTHWMPLPEAPKMKGGAEE